MQNSLFRCLDTNCPSTKCGLDIRTASECRAAHFFSKDTSNRVKSCAIVPVPLELPLVRCTRQRGATDDSLASGSVFTFSPTSCSRSPTARMKKHSRSSLRPPNTCFRTASAYPFSTTVPDQLPILDRRSLKVLSQCTTARNTSWGKNTVPNTEP